VLGRLSEEAFLGGRRRLDRELAERAVGSLAEVLDLDVPSTAAGMVRIVDSNMVDAIQAVSIQRGIDPRGFVMVVGGGAGGLHAGKLASELKIERVVIPSHAGVLCSYGMTVTDVRHDLSRADRVLSRDLTPETIAAEFAPLEQDARSLLSEEGFETEGTELRRFVDARYPNQVHELTIPVPAGELPVESGQLEATFHEHHRIQFSYAIPELPVEILHWRVSGIGRTGTMVDRNGGPAATPKRQATPWGTRAVFFDELDGYTDVDIFKLDELRPGDWLEGPAVVESETTTIIAPPGHHLSLLNDGSCLLEAGSGDPGAGR
jgi:N-methylhydantoinase A